MTVKSKLLSNVALTIIGIAVIAGIGLFSIGKVKSSIEILTGKSTPLHLKMLELQQTVEKVSADFMRLEMTTEPAEVARLSETITGRIRAHGDPERRDPGRAARNPPGWTPRCCAASRRPWCRWRPSGSRTWRSSEARSPR